MFEMFLVFIAAFFIGYIIGKRRGRILGGQEAASSYPLLLRQQSFEKGYCLLCREIVSTSGEGMKVEPPSQNETRKGI
jgi:hypothetical protein